MKTIAIIGGGASGLAAAIAAGEELARAGRASDVRIRLFEADDERVGRSILATGNGRCNFSNARIDPVVYRNAGFVEEALRELARVEGEAESELPDWERLGGAARPSGLEAPVQRFFSDLGLMWREEAQGRLYPLANKASSVLDVLRAAIGACGIEQRFGYELFRIDAPAREEGRIHLRFRDGSIEHADAAVLAVGGRAIEGIELPGGIGKLGCRPVLGPLRADPRITRQLNNIRVKCDVSLVRGGREIAREHGELLFRDYGVSGVCVFNLSRFAEEGDELSIDLVPQLASDARASWLLSRKRMLEERFGAPLAAEDVLRGVVLPQVAHVACTRAGIDPARPLAKRDAGALARVLGAFSLSVQGIGDARQCQVSRGGVAVGEVCPETLQTRRVPGLFVVGEALDVDAPCGGYNLHWAWSSGIIAGRAAVRRVLGA